MAYGAHWADDGDENIIVTDVFSQDHELVSIEQVQSDIFKYPQAAIDAMDLLVEHNHSPNFGGEVMKTFIALVDAYHDDGMHLVLQDHVWVARNMDLFMPRVMRLLGVEAALDGWHWPVYTTPAETVTEDNDHYGMF